MSVPVLTFFNNKGGVGKTSLIYHLAWMFSSLGKKILAADLDPQANLTAAFLTDDEIEEIWNSEKEGSSIFKCLEPITKTADLGAPDIQEIAEGLYLLVGDVALSKFEDVLSNEWSPGMNNQNLYRPMRILSSFWQIMQMASEKIKADLILVDIGPNLGAINRSVLISTDFVVIPLGADLFSLQGLKNIGPQLREWKKSWQKRCDNWYDSVEKEDHPAFKLPEGKMEAIGYVCQQYIARSNKPVQAYEKWVNRIPNYFRTAALNTEAPSELALEQDSYCLATIRHYRSLMPMAQENKKPIFALTSADGAIGSHSQAVQKAREDYKKLAQLIAQKINIPLD